MPNVDLLYLLPGTVNSNGTAVALRFEKHGRVCKVPILNALTFIHILTNLPLSNVFMVDKKSYQLTHQLT